MFNSRRASWGTNTKSAGSYYRQIAYNEFVGDFASVRRHIAQKECIGKVAKIVLPLISMISALDGVLHTFKSSGMIQVEGLLVALIISRTSRMADSTRARAALMSRVYPIPSE